MSGMDFQAREQKRFRVLRAATLVLVVLAAISLLAALLIAQRYSEELVKAEQETARLRAELSSSLLGAIDFTGLLEQARTGRRVVAHLGAPLPDVLQSLTNAIPPNVRLELFEYDAREGAGKVRARSPDAHALADFVRILESSSPVRRAIVARQETVPGPEQAHRYDIHLVAEP